MRRERGTAGFGWPRWTIGRMMVAVALIGLVLGLTVLMKRRNHLQMKVLYHEVLLDFAVNGHHHGGPDPERARFHAMMKARYERAVSRPWELVEVDPPRP